MTVIILLLCTLLNFCSLFHGTSVERMYCIIGYIDLLRME